MPSVPISDLFAALSGKDAPKPRDLANELGVAVEELSDATLPALDRALTIVRDGTLLTRVAQVQRRYFEELLEAGFTEGQAMDLLLSLSARLSRK